MSRFTVYFATDLHGSERCFRKFLNAGKFYGAHAVILGGDVAGKALIPVVSGPQGSFEATAYGKSVRAEGEDGLASIEDWVRALGCYPYRATPDELQEMRAKLNMLAEQLDPAQPTIFNLHNPPFGTATDRAFKLNNDMRIQTAGGEPVQVPVGSHAIRESIENVQPVVALCGHIHESRAT